MSEHELWDAETVAAYLGYKTRYFLESVSLVAGFPPAIRFPVAGGRKSRPRWKAKEIMKYIDSYQEKRRA